MNRTRARYEPQYAVSKVKVTTLSSYPKLLLAGLKTELRVSTSLYNFIRLLSFAILICYALYSAYMLILKPKYDFKIVSDSILYITLISIMILGFLTIHAAWKRARMFRLLDSWEHEIKG